MLPSKLPNLRRAFLAAAMPIHLKGIAGPGAPHVFKFQRRSNCCYWDCLVVELLRYLIYGFVVSLFSHCKWATGSPKPVKESRHSFSQALKIRGAPPDGIEDNFFRLPRDQHGADDVILLLLDSFLNMTCKQLFGT